MTPLSDTQKQLLFDYSFGLTTESQAAEVEDLLSSSHEATELYNLLRSALSPLDSVELEPCPDELAERTIMRLKERARAAGDRLGELISAEQTRTVPIRVPFWRNWTEVVAAAAAVTLFIGILLPALGLARQKHWQNLCQSRLSDVYGGVASYVSDHDGQLPMVAAAPGSPWWKVGTQGPENHSNTRRAWLLVRQGYVVPVSFLCAARGENIRVDFDPAQIARFNDFPSRAYIQFSVRIDGVSPSQATLSARDVFMADLNPLSERFPLDYSISPSIELVKALMTANSRNHRGRGQNVLLCDGSVQFTRTRRTTFSDDDIYTLQAMSCGCKVNGNERPVSNADNFVAP